MADRKEEVQRSASWLSVPQFGEWEQKGGVPDYSLDFSKIRENRKLNKREPSRASIGNEDELINPTAPAAPLHQTNSPSIVSPTPRRSFLSYFNCCVKA